MFFVNSIDRCYKLKLFLESFSIRTAVLNYELPHNSRYHIIQEFNKGIFDYLIATDNTVESDDESEDEADNNMEKQDSEENVDGDSKEDKSDQEEQDTVKNDKNPKKNNEKKPKKRLDIGIKKKDFSVSRGVDFKDIKTVVNFDFPITTKSYVHRIGRTARAGRKGTALSLVTKEEQQKLDKVSELLKRRGLEISQFSFNLEEIIGFRYRVEDVLRSVTKVRVKEARIQEIKSEILNSKKLKAHFEDNPRDLQALQHDKPLQPAKVVAHLKNIPDYLVPARLKEAANSNSGGHKNTHKGKDTNKTSQQMFISKKRKTREDPLKSFSYKSNKRARKN